MPDTSPNVWLTAITTLVSGGIGAIITNSLNAHFSNGGKIWELRRVAYGSILSELALVEHALDNVDEFMREDAIRYFKSDISDEHSEYIGKHLNSAKNSYSENYLMLSDAFIELFEDFRRSLYSDPNSDPIEEHNDFIAAVRAARPKLLQQARSEMPLRGLGAWVRRRIMG